MIQTLILEGLFLYYFKKNSHLDKNKTVLIVGLFCFLLGGLGSGLLPIKESTYLAGMVVYQLALVMVYLIFYNNDLLSKQFRWLVPLFASYSLALVNRSHSFWFLVLGLVGLWTSYLLREKVSWVKSLLYGALSLTCLYLQEGGLLVIILSIDLLEAHQGQVNDQNINLVQGKFLAHQYQEIKQVYLNMRGWRHDYHNHIQAMRAYIAMDAYEGLDDYLNTLEDELEAVDALVKSGHLMMDAILNSKVTLMLDKQIRVNFKAILPDNLAINDIDLCVMVSNLLDNAMESCMAVDEDQRFIRIFTEVHQSQFYLSVQNSAKEDLDFNQRHYISNKRGDHGLGVKRVQFLVDKYKGYLNLQNESGIFASEISIPL